MIEPRDLLAGKPVLLPTNLCGLHEAKGNAKHVCGVIAESSIVMTRV